MKRKIIALLMATVCSTGILVSCDGKKKSCDVHLDANNDGICDGCEKAVVHVIEQLPPEVEQEVAMVVNPIPTGVKMSDFISSEAQEVEQVIKANAKKTTLEEVLALREGEEIESINTRFYNNYQYLLVTYSTLIKTINTELVVDEEIVVKEVRENFVKLFDVVNDKVVLSFKSGEAVKELDLEAGNLTTWVIDEEKNATYQDAIEVEFEDGYIRVEEYTKNRVKAEFSSEYTLELKIKTSIYTYAWDLITSKAEEPNISSSTLNVTTQLRGDYIYVSAEGMTYSVDAKTNKIVTLEDATKASEYHLQRPTFDVVAGNNGYVIEDSRIYVYDLTKWISCVQVIEFPSYWLETMTCVLADGNILVQYIKELPNSTINYDIMEGNYKLDVGQVIINPITAEQKEVEFGYLIAEQHDNTGWTEKAINVFTISPIENKTVSDKEILVAVDNSLNILYAYQPTLIGQDIDEFEYIAPGVFKTTINYGDGISQDVLINKDGEKITVIPTNASFKYGLAKIGTKYYKLDMETEVLDTAKYDSVTNHNGYTILMKVEDNPAYDAVENPLVPQTLTKYYFFNGGEVVELTEKLYGHLNEYFVTTVEDNTDPDNVKTIYKLYNAQNQFVAQFDSYITHVQQISEGVYGIILAGGDFVVLH